RRGSVAQSLRFSCARSSITHADMQSSVHLAFHEQGECVSTRHNLFAIIILAHVLTPWLKAQRVIEGKTLSEKSTLPTLSEAIAALAKGRGGLPPPHVMGRC